MLFLNSRLFGDARNLNPDYVGNWCEFFFFFLIKPENKRRQYIFESLQLVREIAISFTIETVLNCLQD